MDPIMLMQLLRQYGQMSQNPTQQGGFGQLPQMQQMPQGDGQLPPMAQGAPPEEGQQHHGHGGGFSPLMAISPLGGLFASKPKAALSMLMSPAFGMSNLMGAFK